MEGRGARRNLQARGNRRHPQPQPPRVRSFRFGCAAAVRRPPPPSRRPALAPTTVFTFPVESDDVIVAGTDGLFYNLYNNEIIAIVVHVVRAKLEPQVTTQKIAALTRQRAQDKNWQMPFSTAAQDAGYRYYGGKMDYITVVVSYVTASTS
ncbi:putative protein phosphatase 2C 55 [Platanthera zijinensis]|uniref:Protein phosphatase n=1 Tax=Platanthera zijinensis TaxID=2320716 RepID=A0AAP0G3K2_9ASPA